MSDFGPPPSGWCDSRGLCAALLDIAVTWIKTAPAFLATLLAALVAGSIAIWIAYHQYRIAKAKLNLDLFEKRLAIFRTTWSELSRVSREGAAGPGQRA